MDRRQFLKASVLLGAASVFSFTGCASDNGIHSIEEPTEPIEKEADVTTETGETAPDDGISDEQRNSVNMFNYLVTVTREINESQNSRLLLEQVYSELVNNTEPSAVDTRTLAYIEELLDSLETFRMVAVKRERLRYIFEKNRADSIMQAVPNPIGMLSAAASFDMRALVASVAYMAVDSATSYGLATSEVEYQYLEDGWELDDEASAALHDLRQGIFSYMVQIANDYKLPSGIMLSEDAVDNFVVWRNEPNVARRIQYLEDNEDMYGSFGPYWLARADAYYENGDWAECLEAVDSYEALNVTTFRCDCDYARVLPAAITAAEECFDDKMFVERAARYTESMVSNARKEDWAFRYFAAITYVSIYMKSDDPSWLEAAYDLALENVNELVGEQDSLNATYLTPVLKVEAPEGSPKDERNEIESYNAMLEEERKKELPPVEKPLLANLTLLKALSDFMNKDEAHRKEIDQILFGEEGRLFLIDGLNARFSFAREWVFDSEGVKVEFSGSEMRIPARYVCDASIVSVVVSGSDENVEETRFDDWSINRVERGTEGDIETFIAVYESETARKYHYVPDMEITISVDIYPGQDLIPVERLFKTINTKDVFYKYLFVWESSIGFVEE